MYTKLYHHLGEILDAKFHVTLHFCDQDRMSRFGTPMIIEGIFQLVRITV